jgi:molybdenum cofactor cytidylyltransferase
MITSSNISIIVLAAGSSSRLGTPKQLVTYQGNSLLRHICEVSLKSKADSLYVVLGSQKSRMEEEIATLNLNIVDNPHWQTGISTSIHAGIQALPNSIDAALILLCDQPKITPSLIDTLIDLYNNSHKPIIACRYGGTVGVPALYGRKVFPDLLNLHGDEGAKRIIERHPPFRLLIDFPEGIYDIDSPDDSNSLK